MAVVVGAVDHWVRDVVERGIVVARRRRRAVWWGDELTLPSAHLTVSAAMPAVQWAFRDGDATYWGVGEAKSWRFERGPTAALLKAVGDEWQAWRELPDGCRLGGGLGFWPKTPGGAWRGFPAAALVLPTFTVREANGQTRLSLAVELSPETTWRHVARRLRWPAAPEPLAAAPLNVVDVTYRTDPAAFAAMVGDALRLIELGRFDKVVLARSVRLQFDRPVDVERVWRHLNAQGSGTAAFLVRHGAGVFMGATPELLARVEGRRLESMSLAGTVGPGMDPGRLLAEPTFREEHEWVRRHLAGALAEVGEHVQVPDEPTIRQVGPVSHLYTPGTATLAAGRTLWDAVFAVHPSPAVGGAPTAAALEYIAGHEGFDRGWYAGAVGLVDRDNNGAFWVALRSGLVREAVAVLYSGVGIVSGAVPAYELDETSWKMLPMLSALAEG